jgi:hypothetical protein
VSRSGPTLTRRRLLVLLAGVGIGGCAAGVNSARDEAPPTARPTTEPPTAEPTPEPTLEAVEEPTEEPTSEPEPESPAPYEPVAGEVYPGIKRLAANFAQALTTYAAGEPFDDVVARAAADVGPRLDLAAVAAEAEILHRPEVSAVGEIIYPQLGGLDPMEGPRRSSVMVVVRQTFHEDRGDLVVERTMDVRLRLEGEEWVIEDLPDAGGVAVDLDGVRGPAADVLADERIELPGSAQWDIASGSTDERLLRTMLEMAEIHPFAVCTLRTGHPVHVFGTNRESNHTAGRAVDVWSIGGEPVVTQQPATDSPAYEMSRALFDRRVVPELGAPWAFDGVGGRSFTNTVHLDHVHVAFYGR